MDMGLKIAGDLTVGDWKSLKQKLDASSDETLWSSAFEFFEKRIDTRYLKAIEAIEKGADVEGEGFAITAIVCSLIEAMETFRSGKVYRRPSKDRPLDKEREYYQESEELFVSFLTCRKPFSDHFLTAPLAVDFYRNVRCAVLHEAATRNGWRIRINTTTLLEKHHDGTVILNRLLFVEALRQYIRIYKSELLGSIDLKRAFCRKLDSICETA
jgi:hypothetical protein